MPAKDLNQIVSLAKRRGFVFQSSEIYGGLNSSWDYAPLGVELKLNVKKAWWRSMVKNQNIVGLDSSILMHPRIWEASGHLENFTDPLVDCKKCKNRFREDEIDTKECPKCGGELTEPRLFNLMFKTFMGPVEDAGATVYLRPETAQGIFVNFQNVYTSMRKKLPFGIAQIGKAFRNEITPGNFIFRTREFEQMEMQFFVRPEEDEKWFETWKETRMNFHKSMGVNTDNLRFHEHPKDKLAHYAKAAFDIEYKFEDLDWQEIEGIHNRTDFDLKQHTEFSGKNLHYVDEVSREKFFPYVIETSVGCDRSLLMYMVEAYTEDTENDRIVMKFNKKLAPVKLAILPLMKKPKLLELSDKIYQTFVEESDLNIQMDITGSIGKRYRRQDEIGTPYCVTVDYDSLEDNAVTVRDRDTMAQKRVSIDTLYEYISKNLRS